MKIHLFVPFALVISILSCGHGIKPVELANIDSVLLIPHFPDNTIGEPPIKLNELNTSRFISDLNNSRSKGLCKWYPSFIVIIYMKTSTPRYFRANGENIKENTDECFVIGDKKYFTKLYKNNQKCLASGAEKVSKLLSLTDDLANKTSNENKKSIHLRR
jgi:hypothetical protein